MNAFDTIMIIIGMGTATLGVAAIIWSVFTLINDWLGDRQADRARANRARVMSQLTTTDAWNGVTEYGDILHNDGVTVRKVGTWSEISPRDRRLAVRVDGIRWTANSTNDMKVIIADHLIAQGW